MTALAPDLEQARRFLELLDPDAGGFTFQTFDDSALKRGYLAKICHGLLEGEASRLTAWSRGGAGVFVTVNETNGMGRKEENILRTRAVFVDLDGSPLQPVMAGDLEPHITVESSPGRWHAYWLVEGLELGQFSRVQKAIAVRFKGDRSVNDLPRVMRLPGFLHQKAEPFLTRIHSISERLPYSAVEILAAFPPEPPKPETSTGNGHDGDPLAELVRQIMTGEVYHDPLCALAWRHLSDGMDPGKVVLSLRGYMDASQGPRDDRWRARYAEIPRTVRTAQDKLSQQDTTTQSCAIPPVEPIDAWTFINLDITPRRFVIEPWLPEKGLAMVHAKAGIGKTWLALGCAHAIATGGGFLKWMCPTPRTVAYLDGEMAASEMQGRLRTLFIDPDGAGHFQMVSFDLYDGPVPNLGTEEGQQRVAAVIDQAEAIVIDNLSCLVGDQGRSDAETWDSVQPWLLSLRRAGKTVIMVHHSGKSGAQRGTSKRADPLDAVIKLDRPSDATAADGCRFTITFEKARGMLGNDGEPFEAMLADGVWTTKDEDRDRLELVADLKLEGKSIRKIADITGIPRTTVNRMLKLAYERGVL